MLENVHFSSKLIAGYAVMGTLCVLLPVVLLIVWRVKTKENLVPALVGAVVFVLFALVLESIPKNLIISREPIASNPWLLYPIASLFAGVFEETGRFLAYKFPLTKFNGRRTSITYGIGHGGIESVVLVGLSAVSLIVLAIMVNTGNTDELLSEVDESQQELLIEQITTAAEGTFSQMMLSVVERISAITFHISMSVLVFAAAREKRYVWLYPLAIFLHFLLDFTVVFYAAELVNMYVMELYLLAFSVVVAVLVYRFYKKLPERFGD